MTTTRAPHRKPIVMPTKLVDFPPARTTLPTEPDYEGILALLDWIEANNAKWDQETWGELDVHLMEDAPMAPGSNRLLISPVCGSACCLAGWKVQLEGYALVVDEYALQEAVAEHYDTVSTGRCVDPITGLTADIARKAANLFGLGYHAADLLFNPGNSIEEMRALVAGWMRGAVVE